MASPLTTEKPVTIADHYEIRDDDGNIKGSDVIADAATKGQAVTGYESLTPWQTIKHFKMATAICFAAAFSAATDGYQIGCVSDQLSPFVLFLLSVINILLLL